MAKIKLIVSMDWEGCDLLDKNLDAIKAFKAKHNCPITHYLNAGYYTNPKTKHSPVTDKIHATMAKDDEAGLHLHAPRHFVRAAGVGLKSSPTFSKAGDYNSGDEFGQEVMLHGYSKPELDRMIALSKSILEDKGLGPIRSFRAGGWQCDEKLLESLADNEFQVESSATVANLLDGSSWENDNLQRYISMIWDGITTESGPYTIKCAKKDLLEIPNNLGAIDYWKEDWVLPLAARCFYNAISNKNYVGVINSHQETFVDHVEKLENFIQALKEMGAEEFEFTTNKAVFESLRSA